MTPLGWREPPLNNVEKAQRAKLTRVLKIARRFERAARPRTTRRLGDRDYVRLVIYAHLIRSIQLCKAIVDLRENPVEYVLLRTLSEAFINLRFILSDAAQTITRARNFYDYAEVNRLRLLLEIARRFPHIPLKGHENNLRRSLEKYKPRFLHKRSDNSTYWDWDKLDLVSRVEDIGKSMKSSKEDANKFRRIVALYQETNPYVHCGMLSLMDSIDRGGGGEAIRPKLRAKSSEIGVPFVAATLLADAMAAAGDTLNVVAYEREIRLLAKGFQRFLKKYKKMTDAKAY